MARDPVVIAMQTVRKHQAETDRRHMNEAEQLKEATEEERGYSQELPDRVTHGLPVAAKRPFDLSPDASTLYDLIAATKELSAAVQECGRMCCTSAMLCWKPIGA
jgi:hypothetical protein